MTTHEQLDQQDMVDNTIYNAVREIIGNESISWDMEYIGEIRSLMVSYITEYTDIPEMDIYPYNLED